MKIINSLKLIFTLLFLSLFQYFSYGQNSTGANFLSASEYASLPRPNWSVLQSYSTAVPNADGTYATAGVVMLNNPPIGNQGTEGSCVGWAVGYTAMGILTYPKSNCWATARRSPSYVYNQIRVGTGCGGGSFINVATNLVRDQGVCSWNLMPYVDGACALVPNTAQINDASLNRATNWAALNRNDFLGVKRAIDLGFPVVIGFDVTQDFDNMWGSSGIWSTNNGASRGGHATCIVGYDDTRQQFKVQNQWGPFGGDNGYFWVTYNMIANNCCREMFIIYGSTPSVPLDINGPNSICVSTSNNYTINSLPCNSLVTWSINSTDGIALLTNYTGSSTSITIPSGFPQSASIFLTATISGFNTPITKTIYYGQPSFSASYKNGVTANNPLAIYFSSSPSNFNNVCLGYNGVPNVFIEGQAIGASNLTWSIPSGYNDNGPFNLYTGYGTNGNRAYFGWPFGGPTYPGYIKGTVSNSCGTYTQIFAFQQVNCGTTVDPCATAKESNYFTISPNPASDNIQIGVSSKPAPIGCKGVSAIATPKGIVFSKVNIYNSMGVLLKSYKTTDAKSMTIQITDLQQGVYTVEIMQEDYSEKQQIIIK
jgi:Papain family cysteine protease/Secretion system C-terminal sorting domain